MLDITEDCIETILKVFEDNGQGAKVTRLLEGWSKKELGKFNRQRCTCGKTVGNGIKACFGLTESISDSDGNTIVLHILPQGSSAGKAALYWSVVAWLLSCPEFWHLTGKSIVKKFEEQSKNQVNSLFISQGVSIVKRQIYEVDMENAKVQAFTQAVADFLVSNPEHMDKTEKGELFVVLSLSTFGPFQKVNEKIGKTGLWGFRGDSIKNSFDIAAARTLAEERIAMAKESTDVRAIQTEPNDASKPSQELVPEAEPAQDQDNCAFPDASEQEPSYDASAPQDDQDDDAHAPDDLEEFVVALQQSINGLAPSSSVGSSAESAIVPFQCNSFLQNVLAKVRAASLGQAQLLDLGRDIFLKTGSTGAFFGKLLAAGLDLEVVPWTQVAVWKMLTQEADCHFSADSSRMKQILDGIEHEVNELDELNRAIQAAKLCTEKIKNDTAKWNSLSWATAVLLVCRAKHFLNMGTHQACTASICDCHQAAKLCTMVELPANLRFALELRSGWNPLEYDISMCMGHALLCQGNYNQAKDSFADAERITEKAILVAQDCGIDSNLSSMLLAPAQNWQARADKAKQALDEISKTDTANPSIPLKEVLDMIMKALLVAKASPELHLRKFEVMGVQNKWNFLSETLTALATKNMQCHVMLHEASNSGWNPFPMNPYDLNPVKAVLRLRPYQVYGEWYVRTLRLQNRLKDANESLCQLESLRLSNSISKIDASAELSWLKAQRFVLDECLILAGKSTVPDLFEEVEQLKGCLNLEPLYKRGSLHSVIHRHIGDLYSRVSSSNPANYALAVEHFSKSLDIEPNSGAYVGRAICQRDHSLPNKEGALNDFNSALDIEPSNLDVLVMRADLKMDLTVPDYDGAIADYENWLTLAEAANICDEGKNDVRDKLQSATRLNNLARETPRRRRRSHSADTPSPSSLAAMNLYDRLGVDPQCSMKTLRAALRQKLLKHHPDHGGAQGAFHYINQAAKLRSPDKRKWYNHFHNFGNYIDQDTH